MMACLSFFVSVRYSTMSVLGEFRSMATSITMDLVILRKLICASNQVWYLIEGRNLITHYIGTAGHTDNVDRRTGPLQAPL